MARSPIIRHDDRSTPERAGTLEIAVAPHRETSGLSSPPHPKEDGTLQLPTEPHASKGLQEISRGGAEAQSIVPVCVYSQKSEEEPHSDIFSKSLLINRLPHPRLCSPLRLRASAGCSSPGGYGSVIRDRPDGSRQGVSLGSSCRHFRWGDYGPMRARCPRSRRLRAWTFAISLNGEAG